MVAAVGRRKLSKKLAVMLRHRPDEFGTELDEAGWAPVATVVRVLNDRGGSFATIGRHELREVVKHQHKPRYELSADASRIRAVYGHTVALGVVPPAVTPPAVLFHGTTASAAAVIAAEGLGPMQRRFVYLSQDLETAAWWDADGCVRATRWSSCRSTLLRRTPRGWRSGVRSRGSGWPTRCRRRSSGPCRLGVD